jgi:hypothetical protein
MATAPAQQEKTDRYSGKLLLRMPPALHGDLARAAEREGTSLNAYITQTLSDTLNGAPPRPAPDAAAPRPAAPGPSRFLRIAVIADLVLVAIATVAAVALLIVAL